MEEPVKHMLASLQRQRNSANDRIVDLEVGIAMKDVQINAIQEELANANEMVNILREKFQQALEKVKQHESILDYVVENNGKTFDLVKSEQGEYVLIVPNIEDGVIEDGVIIDESFGETEVQSGEILEEKESSFDDSGENTEGTSTEETSFSYEDKPEAIHAQVPTQEHHHHQNKHDKKKGFFGKNK